MRYLYVFGGERASGAEKVIERLISHNIDNAEAHLFISPGNYADDLKIHNQVFKSIIELKQLKKLNRSNTPKLLFYLLAVRNYLSVSIKAIIYISKHSIECVHANTIVPSSYLLPAIIYSKVFNKKLIWIWSDHDIKYFSGLDHRLSNLCVKNFDLTMCVSEAVKNKYKEKVHHKLKILYNGLDLFEFKPSLISREKFRTNYKIPSTAIIIAIVGTIEPRKGQINLILAFNKIQENHSGCFLFLAGPTSSDYPEYKKQVLELIDKNKSIIYLGKTSEILELYNGCDILINNSSKEGSEPLGTTIIEAMACEKIVGASNTGGSHEIINDKINGYLYEPDNNQELISTLSNIIVNISEQTHITNNARKKIENKFNINIMTKSYNTYIKCIIKKNGK